MTPENFPLEVQSLCNICHTFGERGWCRATSGNFSVRVADKFCLITQSGRDKSLLTVSDLMICDLAGQAVDAKLKPSAETPLHASLYQLDDSIGAVLHTHSVAATLVSRHCGSNLRMVGFEMQKAFAGVNSHEEEISLPIFDNDQDMDALANLLTKAWEADGLATPGFLIRGHGLYAWGTNAAEARRHVEGFEFLFECFWQESLAKKS